MCVCGRSGATARSSRRAHREPYAAVIPDILLERPASRSVARPVDAKYKLYDERKLDQGDIYQTFFYAWAYADTQMSRRSGVHPVPRGSGVTVDRPIGPSQRRGARGIDLGHLD